jgi:nitroreductase
MELMDTILTRRSVRKFTDYTVTDDEIRQILEGARWAPSWANTQVWEFIVIRDKALMERIAGTYVDKNPATKCSLAASVLIMACAKTGVSGCYGGQDVTKFSNWFMFDLGIAVQNLCLKAHELGLGSVVVGLMDHDACKKLVGAAGWLRGGGGAAHREAVRRGKAGSAPQGTVRFRSLEYLREGLLG